MSSTNHLFFSPFSANSAHFSQGWPASLCFPFRFKGEKKKKYSIGKLGYASVSAEISRKWNSTTAEVAWGW